MHRVIDTIGRSLCLCVGSGFLSDIVHIFIYDKIYNPDSNDCINFSDESSDSIPMSDTPRILDATCGGRSIWLDEHKANDNTIYVDRRQEPAEFHGQEGRYYSVQPNILADNRRLPFQPDTFDMAVFDPPHVLRENGMKQLSGHVVKKYGALTAETWQDDLNRSMCELFRVLTDAGTLIFKFADVQTDWKDVLDVLPVDPLFGTTTKKTSNQETRWFTLHASQYNQETE